MKDTVDIDLREIFNILKKGMKTIIISTILFTVLVVGVAKLVLPQQYEAYTTLIVNRNISDEYREQYNNSAYVTTDLEYFRKIASTYIEILTSKTVLGEIMEEFDIDLKYEKFLKRVEATTVNNTEIIRLSVLDTDPNKAMKMCNTIPEIFEKEVVRITNAAGIEVVDKASLPEEIEKPDIIICSILGVAGGMVLGVLIVFLRYVLDNKIKTSKDVENGLDMSVLGQIPFDKEIESIKDFSSYNNTKADIIESFSKIRTNIDFANLDSDRNVILFTSTQKGEGKSLTISNMSRFFSKLDKKVLLIDCDIRSPRIHRVFNLSNTEGLTNTLSKDGDFDRAVNHIDEYLDVLTAGEKASNPSEIMSSKKMAEFIEDISKKYDYVFLDTPPVGIITDASILSKLADGVVFVVSSNEVELDAAKEAKKNLQKVDAKIMGAVLTKVKMSDFKYGYYYGYSDEDSNKKKSRFKKKK